MLGYVWSKLNTGAHIKQCGVMKLSRVVGTVLILCVCQSSQGRSLKVRRDGVPFASHLTEL